MEYAESSDYLFHFTKRYESIVSILTENFKPFFCVEDISFMFEEERNMTLAYPIVCFCDIPNERHSVHKENYGEYGIGLSKDWGVKNNFSIVNYSFPNSLKSSGLRLLVEYYLDNRNHYDDCFKQLFGNPLNILIMTSKPYEGLKFDKKTGKRTNKKVRFYNEREWRYLPLVDQLNWSLSLDDYNDDYNAFLDAFETEQLKIQTKYKLEFKGDDIKIIYLKTEIEKNKLLVEISAHYTESELKKIESIISIN